MPEGTTRGTLALVGLIGVLVLGIVCVPFVGGDSLIRGMGNGGNRIYSNGITDEVAEAIAKSSAVSNVSDDDLQATYLAIRGQAMSGDLDAALVVFRVAEIQRARRRP